MPPPQAGGGIFSNIKRKKGKNMGYNDDRLNAIFDKTSGRCHLCRKNLIFANYGIVGVRGAWEVEHSMPRAKGGSSHLNNLYPACISCNRSKGKKSNYAIRSKNGFRRAPMSVSKRSQAMRGNMISGGVVGLLIGSFLGPWWAVVLTAAGARIGRELDPEG